MPTAARSLHGNAAASYVERIRDHVERDEVADARQVLAAALGEGAREPGLDDWAKILAPAKIIGRHPATGTDLRVDVRWFDEHAKDYRKQWVAILTGTLLAHAETYEDLRAKLAESAPQATPLVHYIE